MKIGPKFVELTADVLRIISQNMVEAVMGAEHDVTDTTRYTYRFAYAYMYVNTTHSSSDCVRHCETAIGSPSPRLSQYGKRFIDSLDKRMRFLPQPSDFVPLRNGFNSFRAQTD